MRPQRLAGRAGPSSEPMAISGGSPAGSGTLDAAAQAGLLLLLVLVPLPFGAVPKGATFALLAWTALLAWLVLARAPVLSCPAAGLQVAGLLAGMVGLALVQLAPLPGALAGRLSPEAVARLDTVPLRPVPDWIRLSVHPEATATQAARLAALAAIFALSATLASRPGAARRIYAAVFTAGLFQALYGSAEYLSGHQHIFGYVKRFYTDSATGTYINHNHFAGALEMSFLVGIGFWLARIAPRSGAARRAGMRARLLALFEGERAAGGALLTAVAAVGLGLVLSCSRSGIAAGFFTALAVVVLDARRRGTLRRALPAALLAGLLLVLITLVGWDRIASDLGRRTEGFTLEEGRVRVWRDSLAIVRDFPLLGSGLGTFRDIYPAYRNERIQIIFDYAHNDYLQAVVETGLVGALLLASILVLFWRAVRRGLSQRRGGDVTLHLGAAGALVSLLLHELTDFNLQIPANAVLFAATAGALLGGLAARDGDGSRVVPLVPALARRTSA